MVDFSFSLATIRFVYMYVVYACLLFNNGNESLFTDGKNNYSSEYLHEKWPWTQP